MKKHIHTIHEGHKGERPFSGVSTVLDFSAHAHFDDNNVPGGSKAVFLEAGKLKRHINTVHGDHKDIHSIQEIHEYKCASCGKSFNSKGYMEKHIKSVHEKTKNRQCTICEKSYFKSQHLNRHIKSAHNNIKNHQCTICEQYFSELSLLKKHLAVVHEGQKAHKCDMCQQLFTTKFNLKTHIKRRHEEV